MSKSLKANRIWATRSEAVTRIPQLEITQREGAISLICLLFNSDRETVVAEAAKVGAIEAVITPVPEQAVIAQAIGAEATAELLVENPAAAEAENLAAAIDARLEATGEEPVAVPAETPVETPVAEKKGKKGRR